ncbi:aminotransferase class I/II-fold pyridoxal phosphate-dependent enzyme [Ramlibacter sp. G-1-2-2]|uniref:histidinol-phosphate transaminase n=1 Tax=Ramlibacter agri TaxID=2728837 RepID=A0A848H736_9BURK|nr:aminotransferase class I/II-fold pyridoxal phosphate-dependent enzyme [Ramlibacter agri]NML45311.1 aminotransferase class I/II-fold pyridoxal phosphate-dependent enzyme [Ramlibacter agri]
MTGRVHGGPGAQGAACYDFSTNANACGPCPQALAAVQGADALRYPDPASTRVREALAAFHGVAVERIVPAASASEMIFRLTAWAARSGVRQVALPRHSYGDYAQAARAWGLVPAADAALAWACEPSSPLGQGERDLHGADGAIVVLDRAYEPLRLTGASSFSGAQCDAMWQLWSPNKALGLTGVRGAYAIAPVAVDTAEAEAMAPSWPLGAHGEAMLLAWCESAVQQWLAASRATLRNWKDRQQALCRDLGWSLQPSDANFFVVQAPQLTAALPALRGQGVQLRDCASFGLRGHARLSVQPPAAQDALALAWRNAR